MTDQKKTRRQMLEEFVARKPDDAFSRYGLAMECMNSGDSAAADEHFRFLLQSNAEYVPAYLMYAQLLVRESRAEEAKTVLSSGIAAAEKKGDQHARSEMEGLLSDISYTGIGQKSLIGRSPTAQQGLVLSAMAFTGPERIPLFPLNVVLLPGATLPLHIFEPRYRQMVRHCIEEKSEFGVLLGLPKGIVRVGCTAAVTEVVKRHSDGRMDILTVGRSPFRIIELVNAEAYANDELLQGDVDFLDDREHRTDASTQKELMRLFEVCHTLIFADYPRNIEGDAAEYLAFISAGP